MNRSSRSGVTLIEILIAVSLLSLLSVGMLVAIRLGLSTLDRTDTKLVKNRRVSNTRGIIESEIQGFVFSQANYHPDPNSQRRYPFLQAEAQSMRFVTSYSIEEGWRGRLRIAALQVIPGENNQGVRLIVNETPYTGPEQAGQQIVAVQQQPSQPIVVQYAPIGAGSQSFVLADRLAYCRFSWLIQLRQPPSQVWLPGWTQPGPLPLAVRIEMAPLESGNTSDLHISTITVPFDVNREPGAQYEDRL